MRRARFLRLSAGALAATLASSPGCARVPEPVPELADPTTLGPIADETVLREIGRAYLDGTPGEARTRPLVRALLEDERGRLVPQDDVAALRRFLEAKVQADFDAGRTVTADGWILAETEARQAALFTLTR